MRSEGAQGPVFTGLSLGASVGDEKPEAEAKEAGHIGVTHKGNSLGWLRLG